MRIRPGVRRLLRLPLRSRETLAAEVDEEIQHHLEERERQLMARGVSEEAARAEAVRRFGDVDAARERLRSSAARRDERLAFRERAAELWQDVRFALRGLRRSRSYLAVTVACLALGIGANAAMFSVIDASLLKALPFREPERLMRVWKEGIMPLGVLDIVRARARAYTDVTGYELGSPVSVGGDGEPARVVRSRVANNFFRVFGVAPALGRMFEPSDATPGSAPVVVLSHAAWQDRFGGNDGVIGQRMLVDGVPHTIVGVMPPTFRFPSARVALYTPLRETRGSAGYWWSTFLHVVGRARPGVSVEQATAEARVVIDGARGAFPMRMPESWGRDVSVVPLQQSLSENSRQLLLLLLGAVALVLLVACVNVATLGIGRANARARELGVRAALGAGRARIVRLLVVESALVALAGTVAGLVVAWLAMRGLVSLLPPGTPRVDEIALDLRVLLFSAALMVLGVVVFGVVPALRATRGDLAGAIRAGATGAVVSSSGRVRGGASSLLVATQIALAVVLVTGAGLLVRTLWELQASDVGFRTQDVLTTELPLPSFASDTASRAPLFYQRVLDEVAAIPGVDAAAVTSSAPFGDGVAMAAMAVEAHPTPAGGVPPTPALSVVSPDFFRTLGIALVRGRLLDASDRKGATRVAVIDETAARTLWPSEDAIGQRIRYVWNQEWITVVGVVRAVRRDSLSAALAPSLYLPLEQGIVREMRLLVHTTGANEQAARDAIRGAVRAADPTVPVGIVRPYADLVSGSAGRSRFAATLLSLFAATALLLGAVGIYGVMSANVAARTREIGVRLAIGATRAQVLSMVLARSLRLAAVGAAAGVLASIGGAGLLERFLYGVRATDVTMLLIAPVVLAIIATLAALVPARRAAAVDPMVAIRAE